VPDYYADSKYCELWQCDDEQECCGETWANNKEGFKYGDNPVDGEKVTIYGGDEEPCRVDQLFSKFEFSELVSDRLLDLLGPDGAEHTEVPDEIDVRFLKWLESEIEINWFKIKNITEMEFAYSKESDKWVQIIGEHP